MYIWSLPAMLLIVPTSDNIQIMIICVKLFQLLIACHKVNVRKERTVCVNGHCILHVHYNITWALKCHACFFTSSARAAGRTASLQRRTGWLWQTGWGRPDMPQQSEWYRGDWGDRGWKPLCRTCPHLTLSNTCWLDTYRGVRGLNH